MKKLLSIVLIAGLLFACDTSKKEESKEIKEPVMEKKEQTIRSVTRFEELKGYFVKNNVAFDQEQKFVAISGQEEFNKYFGIAKTMENKVTPLDFEKYNVAGILVKPSNKASKIKMTRYTSEGAKTIVEFGVESGDDQTFTSGTLLLFKIPKSRTSVDFVTNGTTVNVKIK